MKYGGVISALCCMIVSVHSDSILKITTGEVKKFFDTFSVTNEILKAMTNAIFSDTRPSSICSSAVKPVTTGENNFISDPKPCDSSLYESLKQGVKNPNNFNIDSFLKGFWDSSHGKKFLQEFKNRGANEDLLKAAFKEIWFRDVRAEGETVAMAPFKRLILGGSSESWTRYMSWYTFYAAKQMNPGRKYDVARVTYKDPFQKVKVDSFCESCTATFLYPGHPYVDVIIYTLSSLYDAAGEAHNFYTVTFQGERAFEVTLSPAADEGDGSTFIDGFIIVEPIPFT